MIPNTSPYRFRRSPFCVFHQQLQQNRHQVRICIYHTLIPFQFQEQAYYLCFIILCQITQKQNQIRFLFIDHIISTVNNERFLPDCILFFVFSDLFFQRKILLNACLCFIPRLLFRRTDCFLQQQICNTQPTAIFT